MSQSKWSYLQNPFDNVTKRSNRHMFLMATDHFDKLAMRSTDPKINELYIHNKVYFEEFTAQYRKISTDNASYQMLTERMVRMLEELSSTLARRWDIKIQQEYDVVTVEYKSLLPKGRSLFQSGAYDLRINEVMALANRLRNYPIFDDLRAEIEDFHLKISKARTEQQGIESVVQMNIQEIEAKRLALAKAMHSIFGELLHIYFADTAKIESFYELKYLRKTLNERDNEIVETEEKTIEPNQTVVMFENKVKDSEEIRVVNTGETILSVYTAANSYQKPTNDNIIFVGSGHIATLKVKTTDKLLVVKNEDNFEVGKVFVELLE